MALPPTLAFGLRGAAQPTLSPVITTETRLSTHSKSPPLSNVRHGRLLTVACALLAVSLASLLVLWLISLPEYFTGADVAKDVDGFPCLRILFDVECEDVLESNVAFPNPRMPLHLAYPQ